MKNKSTYYTYKVLVALVMTVAILSACTDVETCNEQDHPHRTSVKFDFDWTASNTDVRPDSMYVVANRVINNWKCAVAVSTTTLKGQYLFNAPEDPYKTEDDGTNNPSTDTGDDGDNGETPSDTEGDGGNGDTPPSDTEGEGGTDVDVLAPGASGDESGDTTGGETGDDATGGATEDTPAKVEETESFLVRTGEYKFVTFNIGSKELVDNEIVDFLNNVNPDTKFQDVNVSYKTYKKDELRGKTNLPLKDWEDHNTYSDYMISDMKPIFFDTTVVTPLPEKTVKQFTFKPKPITQTITIKMEIIKNMTDTFKIDSVWAEISGIPDTINLSRGYIHIASTNKMLFKYSLVDGGGNPREDTYTSTANVRCQAQINVPTIVSNASSEIMTGPGVLQVLVYATAKRNGKLFMKKIQGKINLYNSLKAANLYKYTDDRKYVVRNGVKGTVNINADLVITGSDILASPDNNGGIDRWTPCDEIGVDI